MNLPIERDDFYLILNCVDEKIDWIKRFATHSPSSVSELVRLENLRKRLDRLSDEFVEEEYRAGAVEE